MNSLRLLVVCLLVCPVALAADDVAPGGGAPVEIGAPVTPFVFDGDLRELPAPEGWKPGDAVREIPRRFYPSPEWPQAMFEGESGGFVDPLATAQQQAGTLAAAGPFTTPSRNISGQGFSGVNPPDTVGEVGPDHYIQMINAGGGAIVRIYDKAEPTPNALSTFTLDSLGSGSCGSGLGDPIVLYDRLAGRWMLSEFSSSGNNLCIYVSQTSDPVSGGWFNYGFQAPSFPDYPKYGVWPTDANGGQGSYVATANDGGPGIYAFDRGAMLAGQPATFQRKTIPGLPGFGFESPTPADLDIDEPPPANAPAIIMRHRDTENHNGPSVAGDVLEVWHFTVDWANPGATVIQQQPNVIVSEFDSALCGLTSFNCFPQPNTGTTLDPLREVIMNRLQYINHGEYETLVGNLVTDIDGANTGGIRWFEVRRTGGAGGAWTLHQEGTWSQPDGHSRFMGASSMDSAGNIALAYNVTSSSLHPGLRYTGREAGDTPGLMTQPESVIAAGSGSNSSNRYGDYASMNLDPADDCTFWFTSLWNSSSNWRTQIASFAFESCGCALTPDSLSIAADTDGDNRIGVQWSDSTFEFITEYRVFRSTAPGGPYEQIATLADVTPGVGGGAGYEYVDTSVSGGSTYFYVVRASDGEACTSDASNEAAATATGACLLAPTFAGLAQATDAGQSTCAVELAWAAAATSCPGPVTYDVYRGTSSPVAVTPANRIASGLATSTFVDQDTLTAGATYVYLVRAVDQSTSLDDGNTVERTVAPDGPFFDDEPVWLEDFEDPARVADWTVTIGPGRHRGGEWAVTTASGTRPSAGSGSYFVADNTYATQAPARATSTTLTSPEIDVDPTNVVRVDLRVALWFNEGPDNSETARIQGWNGSAWQTLWTGTSDTNATLSLNVTSLALGNPAFKVRFDYQNAEDDRWFAVDDVAITVDRQLACASGTAFAPVPDGTGGTAPLVGERLTLSGGSIAVGWDTSSCRASGYNLLWGQLADVATATIAGSVCGAGTDGQLVWDTVPAGDVFFLMVGTDGNGTESSWGTDSAGGERAPAGGSGECGLIASDVAAVCP